MQHPKKGGGIRLSEHSFAVGANCGSVWTIDVTDLHKVETGGIPEKIPALFSYQWFTSSAILCKSFLQSDQIQNIRYAVVVDIAGVVFCIKDLKQAFLHDDQIRSIHNAVQV